MYFELEYSCYHIIPAVIVRYDFLDADIKILHGWITGLPPYVTVCVLCTVIRFIT